jgi:hypothetical protein
MTFRERLHKSLFLSCLYSQLHKFIYQISNHPICVDYMCHLFSGIAAKQRISVISRALRECSRLRAFTLTETC